MSGSAAPASLYLHASTTALLPPPEGRAHGLQPSLAMPDSPACGELNLQASSAELVGPVVGA